jgi:hypothetical protein
MKRIKNYRRWIPCFLAFCILFSCRDADHKLDRSQFVKPPEEAGIYTWWHWMDKAITREGITKDLEAMKEQGIVGATILNIGLFGGKDFGIPQVAFNTPEWYDMFRFALQEADRLGIEIGIHNCDGWSTTGGPWIKPEQSMKQYIWSTALVEGGRQVNVRLPKPKGNMDFYRDVAVIAWPTTIDYASRDALPDISINDSIDGSELSDGEPFSDIELFTGDKVVVSFSRPKLVDRIAIHPHRYFQWGRVDLKSRFDVEISANGRNFRKHASFFVKDVNKTSLIPIPAIEAQYFRIIPKEISGLGNDESITISELELLTGDEKPLYFPALSHHLEKTASLQAGSMEDMVNIDTSELEADPIVLVNVVDLTGKMSADGQLNWEAPEGKWVVSRFGYTTTGSENGPATEEGRGLECDKMDTSALNFHFRNFPMKLIDAAGDLTGNTFKYLFIDSWECEYQNWCDHFPAAFEQGRGYSMIPWLPVLCGQVVGSAEETEAFLNDYRKTIAYLIEENFFRHYASLCHQHNLKLHAEVIYGGTNYPPLDVLKTNRYIDLPMTEFWAVNREPGHTDRSDISYTPRARLSAINPTYACAVYGKPMLAAEAYTGFAHYSETPWELKLYGDMAFSFGVNRMVLHSYVHQPWEKKPGFTLGQFGSHFNRHNTWWQHFSGFSTYLARQQYLLQQGKPVSEICYFIGDRMPDFQARQPLSELPYGYKADHCNPDILSQMIVKNGEIILPGRAAYKILLLPDDRVMELETMKKLEYLIADGAIVVGPKPLHCLSLATLEADNQNLKTLAEKVWGEVDGKTVYENKYGKGKMIWGKPVQQVLEDENIEPDLKHNYMQPENFLYHHKRLGDLEIFYLVNQSDEEIQADFQFTMAHKRPSIWDPMDGSIQPCNIYVQEGSRIRVPIKFRPRQTCFVVFERAEPTEHIVEIIESGKTIFPASKQTSGKEVLPYLKTGDDGQLMLYSDRGGEYMLVSDRGNELQVNVPAPEVFIPGSISGTIDFIQLDNSVRTNPVDALKSFTVSADPSVRYFSGTATYRVRFDLPGGWLEPGHHYTIMPGETGATASIQLNGSSLGIVWDPGIEIEVGGLLEAGTNSLTVSSTNPWRNRLIGEIREADLIGKTWTTSPIQQFLDENSALQPDGFTGPFKLIKYTPEVVAFGNH